MLFIVLNFMQCTLVITLYLNKNRLNEKIFIAIPKQFIILVHTNIWNGMRYEVIFEYFNNIQIKNTFFMKLNLICPLKFQGKR